MSDLISRRALDAEMQKAQESLESNSDHVWGLNKGHHAGLAWARRLCADAPAVDAAPVLHAEFKLTGYDEVWGAWGNCRNCGHRNIVGSKYCNGCGAKLELTT